MASSEEQSLKAGHEVTDVPANPLATVGIIVAVFMASVFLGIVVLFKVLNYFDAEWTDEPTHPLASTRKVAESPRLQVDPPVQKVKLEASEQQRLSSYGWVDQTAKVAHIPIERAIELVASGKRPLNPKGPNAN